MILTIIASCFAVKACHNQITNLTKTEKQFSVLLPIIIFQLGLFWIVFLSSLPNLVHD